MICCHKLRQTCSVSDVRAGLGEGAVTCLVLELHTVGSSHTECAHAGHTGAGERQTARGRERYKVHRHYQSD